MSLLLLFGATAQISDQVRVQWIGPYQPGQVVTPSMIGQLGSRLVALSPMPYQVFHGSQYQVPPVIASQLVASDPAWWRFD